MDWPLDLPLMFTLKNLESDNLKAATDRQLLNLNEYEMKQIFLFLIIFLAVSTLALFFMKAILWVLFQMGGKFAVPLAIFLSIIYLWSYKLVRSMNEVPLSKQALSWIWTIGFIELLLLGGLYHLTPQFFPSIVGDFFFQ